jgi:ATP-dependent DNA ligase
VAAGSVQGQPRLTTVSRREKASSSPNTNTAGSAPDLFCVACNMGLEGIVSKRVDRAYGAGRCAHWIKVKNRAPGVRQSHGFVVGLSQRMHAACHMEKLR